MLSDEGVLKLRARESSRCLRGFREGREKIKTKRETPEDINKY